MLLSLYEGKGRVEVLGQLRKPYQAKDRSTSGSLPSVAAKRTFRALFVELMSINLFTTISHLSQRNLRSDSSIL